jgi:hypothetical protein
MIPFKERQKLSKTYIDRSYPVICASCNHHPSDREEDEDSVHMSEGGQRESYEDLRLMLSELLDEKERYCQ